uniref:G protein-coupled receptor n=1 Tax=Globodera pallida TaxID=36090 RepID=A0A183CDI5_GLOPA
MFYIAIADMICLLLCGIMTGYLAIIGAVFCTAPTFIYISGAIALALWVIESTAEILLAFNRCLELSNSWLANLLFGGKRIYLCMSMPTLYGLYFVLFTKPIIFNGIYVTWFQNPHVGYIDSFENTYRNDMQNIHDFIVVAVLPSIYLLFALIVCVKGRKVSAACGANSSLINQKSIFIQVVLISCVNAIASAIYVSMNFVPLSELLILVGQFCWLMAHGIPPFIYLLLNKTVRHDVFIMFARPIAMVFPCITLPAGAMSTLETNHVTSTTTSTNSIRTIMYSLPFIYLLLNKTVRHDVFIMFARPIAMVFPCITLPAGAMSTLETNHVTSTTTSTNSIRTIMSQTNRMNPHATIGHVQQKGSKSDEQIQRVQMSDFSRTTLVNACCKNK